MTDPSPKHDSPGADAPRIERPPSLTELVTTRLRDWIVTGEMELGARLSEVKIAKALNVSRTPVREAVNRLESEGLLRVEAQRGSFVFNLGPAELRKLCDARIALETAAMRTAIAENRAALHGALARICDAMAAARDAGDDRGYLGLDAAFHLALIDGADNVFLHEAYQTMAPRMAALRYRMGAHPDHMAKSFREHGQIRDAVAAGDAEGAIAILHAHIGDKEGSYWRDASRDAAGAGPRQA